MSHGLYGVMRPLLHNFREDLNWSESPEVVAIAERFLRDKCIGITKIEKMRKQKNGDFVLFFSTVGKFRFVEVKTRKPDKLKFFKQDKKLMFEIISNNELGRYSSAISTSKSWWWCYLLTDKEVNTGNLKLAAGWIFRTRYLAAFIEANKQKYGPLIPSYNQSGYTTLNLLIPLVDILHLQANDLE